jgi:uridylate kinase
MAQRRILLKLSGELLCSPGSFGIEPAKVQDLATQVRAGIRAADVQLALVIGGGNFLRGEQVAKQGIPRVTGDNLGMLATIMNALALQSAMEELGVETRVQSAIEVNDLAEPFIWRRCLRHLERGRVVVLAGGIGHPYFSTDTTASLRALQISAQLLAKGTKVRGIFARDPEEDPDAAFYEHLRFQEVLERRLKAMDATAISLCMENNLPILVFNMWEKGNLERVLCGERPGTLID